MDEFQAMPYEAWKKLAVKELKDKPFETLVWQNENGFQLEPYFDQSKQHLQVLPSVSEPWRIFQRVQCDDVVQANAQALEMLNGGVNSIGFDVPITTYEDLCKLLKEIRIEHIETHFIVHSNESALNLLKALVTYCHEIGIDTHSLKGSIARNVLQAMRENGLWKEIMAVAHDYFNHFHAFQVDASIIHNQGGLAYQDIAYALSVGNEWLHQLVEQGLNVDNGAGKINFQFATDSSFFVEIAKYRVFRNLWQLILKQYCSDASKVSVCIHAQTSTYLQTTHDVHNNLLRATTQAMSAAIGMVDSLEVICYDASLSTCQPTALRLARNIQHLLMEEAYLNGRVDFAQGSHYQEELAAKLSDVAWKQFQAMEEQGGIESCESEFMRQVNQSAQQKKEELVSGKRIMVGVNKYKNKNEKNTEGTSHRLTSDFQ